MERRLAEAARLGFERCIVPSGDLRRLLSSGGKEKGKGEVRREGLLIQGASTVTEAITLALGPMPARRRGSPGAERGGRAPLRGTEGSEDLAGEEQAGALQYP
jgi:hypothetical protein